MPVHRPLITEVIERTAQGMTRPYLCMTDDGQAWYVKSAGAHWRSVASEWMAGRLAAAFGSQRVEHVRDFEPVLLDTFWAELPHN